MVSAYIAEVAQTSLEFRGTFVDCHVVPFRTQMDLALPLLLVVEGEDVFVIEVF